MSNGIAEAFIASGQTQSWHATNSGAGWPGNNILEAQPLNTDANLTWNLESVTLNSNGTYTFFVHIHNNGPNSTWFMLQSADA